MRIKDFEEAIRWAVDDLVPQCKILEYQPGNGTRYVIMFARVPPAACERIGSQKNSWLVSLPDGALAGRCMVLAGEGYLDPSYVAEKLNIKPNDDVLVLTEIIGHVLGRKTPSALDEEGYKERIVKGIHYE